MNVWKMSLLVWVSFVLPAFAERNLIAVATNFSQAATQLASQFENESGRKVELVFGSTGKLYAQIVRGAPFDAFLAADSERPLLLFKNGLGASPFPFALGQLVWWAPKGVFAEPDPQSDKFSRIAIANPDLAPYGLAAKESLMAAGDWERVQNKLVMGENIGQTFAMIHSGNADIGLVALSYALSNRNTRSKEVFPARGYAPIAQHAILLTTRPQNDTASEFLAYIKTKEAQEIIVSFGYESPFDD